MDSAKRIVLADDEHFIAIVYKEGLERAGYNVTVAHDGEEALAVIRETLPDLILLDLIMPKMNGFEVLKALKADETLAGIPVVVLTNLSQDNDESEARSYGIQDFIVKANVSLNELLQRIEKVLT